MKDIKKITSVLVFSIVCLFLSATITFAQQRSGELYEKALYTEEVMGELQNAIDLYQQILENNPNDKSVAAKALLHKGICYEKLGKKQAAESYKKVIEQYADQQQTAEIAKTRLQRMNSKNGVQKSLTARKPITTHIPLRKNANWSFESTFQFDFSPDGKKFVYMGRHFESGKGLLKLFVEDVTGTPVHLLTNSSELMEIMPRYSPDGKSIAFLGEKTNNLSKTGYSLAIYIVDANGGKPRQISKFYDDGDTFWGRLIWHPDGKHITFMGLEGIVTINLSGKITNTISIPFHKGNWLSDYSPDGKWILYHSQTKRDFNNYIYNCWLISSSGDKNIKLTQTNGLDGYGTWSKKDYSVYFLSNRTGNKNIFNIKIDPETGEKTGDAEQITFYYDTDVSLPRIAKNKSVLAFALKKSISSILISEDESFENFKTIASGSQPSLSPDGKTVYYIGNGKNNHGIFSIPRSGGVAKRLTDNCSSYSLSPDGLTLAFITKGNGDNLKLWFFATKNEKLLESVDINYKEKVDLDWSPDSKTVTYGFDDGVYTVPAWGNKAKKLTLIENGEWEPWDIKWSPDGRYIAGIVKNLDDDNSNDIVIVSTNTGELKRLTNKEEEFYKIGVEWHPGSKKLAYMSYDYQNDYDGVREAYVDGRPSTLFINQPDVNDYWGIWDPSGDNFYFKGKKEGIWSYFKYNSVSKKITPLSGYGWPSWDKDGKLMVFSKSDSQSQFCIMENFE